MAKRGRPTIGKQVMTVLPPAVTERLRQLAERQGSGESATLRFIVMDWMRERGLLGSNGVEDEAIDAAVLIGGIES